METRNELREVKRIAIIGAGTMGTGIAIATLDAGLEAVLLEQDATALERGVARIREHYARRVAAGKLTEEKAAGNQSRLHPTVDWQALAQADVVIEAVFEDLGVKQEVFRRVDQVARPGAILATNTSYLDVDAIANVTSRAQDVVGLHFFSPANVMRLLEVVRGASTTPDVIATSLALAERLGKVAVVTGNAFGFVGNRIFSAYRRQCEFILEEGALPHEVDAGLEAFGFAMGPFAVADLSGLDIAWRMRQSQAATRDPLARYVDIPDRLCEAGRLGRKTGAGYYLYEAAAGNTRGNPDPAVRELVEEASAAKGIARRSFTSEGIQRRAVLAMVSEAARVIAEGVAACAEDVDTVLLNGYGFPREVGGPISWARKHRREDLQMELDKLSAQSGPGFVAGDLRHIFSD